MHSDLGFKVMESIMNDLAGVAQVEKRASIEGRNITMIMTPGPAGQKK